MAKDNLKLKVAIDGDNAGFKRALTQTEKDTARFEKRITQGGGVGFGEIAGLAAVTQLPKAIKAVIARKQMNTLSGVMEAKSIRDLRAEVKNNDGPMHEAAVENARQRLAAFKADGAKRRRLRKDAQPLHNVKTMLPAIIGAMSVAGVWAAVSKAVGNQTKFDEGTRAMSGAVLADQAKLDIVKLKQQLAQAKNPEFIAQQKQTNMANRMLEDAGVDKNGASMKQFLENLSKAAWAGVVDGLFNINQPGVFAGKHYGANQGGAY